MAVAFDAVGPSSAGATSAGSTTLSWTHTNVGGGVALVVAVAVSVSDDTGFSVTAKLDPAGANTTIPSLGAIIHSNAGTAGFIALFGLPDVSSGAHTITVTVAGGTPSAMEGGSTSFTGADTTSPFGTQQSATGTGTAPSITFTGSTSGNRVTAGLAVGQPINSMSAGTSRWIRNVETSTAAGNAGQGDIAGGGSVVLTWSTAADDWHGIAAVEVKVPSATAPTLVPSAPRRAHRRIMWMRRSRSARPTPAQPTPPPTAATVRRRVLWRRPRRASTPIPVQVAPPPPPYPVAAFRPRRVLTGLRRARTGAPTWPQQTPPPPPPYPVSAFRPRRILTLLRRAKRPAPIPVQAPIPPEQLTYIFRTPTSEGPRIPPMVGGQARAFEDSRSGELWRLSGPQARLGARTRGNPVGITVLKEGGVFVEMTNPSADRLAAAERVYMGGYEHTVTGQDALDLIAAGYVLIPM